MSDKRTSGEVNIKVLLDRPSVDWDELLLQVSTAYGCSAGTIHTLDKTSSLLHLQAFRNIPDFLLPKMQEIPIGKGMAGIAAERLEPVEMCNLQTDSSGVARPAAKETKVEGSIAVPMLFNGTLHGVFGIAKPVPYNFTQEEINNLMVIGEEISEYLFKSGSNS